MMKQPPKHRSAFTNADDFEFRMAPDELVQLEVGATQFSMTIDAAFELQYKLAGFLAGVELEDYPEELESDEHEKEDAAVVASREALVSNVAFLAAHRRTRSS